MNKFQLTLAFLAALTTAGCASLGLGSGSTDSDGTSTASRGDSARGGPQVSDSEIIAAVKEAFKQDAQLATTDITVTADKGVVTLSGNVPNVQTYLRAGSLARNVPGVRPPVNVSNLRYPL